MKDESDVENVVYLDEYPELKKRVWLRRIEAQRHLGIISTDNDLAQVYYLPKKLEPPDSTA